MNLSLTAIIVLFAAVVIWFLPIALIAISNRTAGGEKAAWLLAVIFVSWLAWIFYLLLAPLKAQNHSQA